MLHQLTVEVYDNNRIILAQGSDLMRTANTPMETFATSMEASDTRGHCEEPKRDKCVKQETLASRLRPLHELHARALAY